MENKLIAGFSFDEGNGNITKSHGKVLVDATIENVEWDEGVKGTALRFHPSERSKVSFGKEPVKALAGADGITVTGWFYVNDKPIVDYCVISLNIDGTNAGFKLSYYNDDFRLEARSCPEDEAQMRTYTCTDVGKWLFITATCDYKNKTVKLFVNGNELTSTQGTDAVQFKNDRLIVADDDTGSTIGWFPTSRIYTNSFSGLLDEWNIYSGTITADEAKGLYVDYGTIAPREKDAAKYAILRELTKNSYVLATGANEVFYDNKRHRIDWDNINATPCIYNDIAMVPVKFISDIFGAQLDWAEDNKSGMISYNGTTIAFDLDSNVYNINGADKEDTKPKYADGIYYLPLKLVFEAFGKYVYCNDGLFAIGDKDEVAAVFEKEGYAQWAKDALCILPYKQQTANHAASRVEIAHSGFGITSRLSYASPSLIRMKDGALLAYHDAFVVAGPTHGAFVYRSDDNGVTWNKTCETRVVNAQLFEHKDAVYIMGVKMGTTHITLQKSTDGGYTWTDPVDSKTGIIPCEHLTQAHCQPTPVVVHNGRIYRAIENIIGVGFKNFCSVVMSADVDADLLDADSWTFTNHVQRTFEDVPDGVNTNSPGWLEGNAVVAHDGSVKVLMRVNFEPHFGYAAMFKLSEDNKTLSFEKYIKFDGGMTKFVIHRDEKTGKYISLVNNITNVDYSKQRTVLSMSVSDDLENWQLVETLLYPNVLENWENIILTRGFQYVDWIFDGDDILYIVREAAEGANNFHDANVITLYKIKDFRKYF